MVLSSTAGEPPRRILLIRPSALGDVCRTVPVLVSLKRAYPRAEIDWLVQDSFAAAVAHHPDLHEPVLFPRSALKRWWTPAGGARSLAFLRSLGGRGYDLVVDCQGLLRSALFARATGARRRIGYANAQELGWLFYTVRRDVPRSLHTVDRMLALAEAAGAPRVADMRLYPPPEERGRLAADPDLAGRRYVVLAPTSRWPGKRWPIDRFRALADALLADPHLGVDAVVAVGAPGERDQCAPLLDPPSPRIIDRIGRTSVGGLMALIERAALVVASDSAALHMAVGLGDGAGAGGGGVGRPIIGLFGPTDLSRVGPYGRPESVLQHIAPGDTLDHKDEAAGRRLMERITTEEVFARAAGVLGGGGDGQWAVGVRGEPNQIRPESHSRGP